MEGTQCSEWWKCKGCSNILIIVLKGGGLTGVLGGVNWGFRGGASEYVATVLEQTVQYPYITLYIAKLYQGRIERGNQGYVYNPGGNTENRVGRKKPDPKKTHPKKTKKNLLKKPLPKCFFGVF